MCRHTCMYMFIMNTYAHTLTCTLIQLTGRYVQKQEAKEWSSTQHNMEKTKPINSHPISTSGNVSLCQICIIHGSKLFIAKLFSLNQNSEACHGSEW